MKQIIINPENPQGKLVDLTQEEIAQREQDAIQREQDRLTREAELEAQKQAKQSALVKLQALGLTEEEVKSIL